MDYSPLRFAPPEERFAARTEWQNDCLVWTGALDNKGYGSIRANGRRMGVHRYAWERQHGPILAGMVIDHRCRNTACVNVDHLRVCTQRENSRAQSVRGQRSAAYRGVSPHHTGRWRARVNIDGREHMSLHDTPEEARDAAHRLRVRHFGEAYAGNDWKAVA